MRRAALVVLVALVAAGAAGAQHPRDPRQAFTAGDQAFARQIALRAADLPGAWRPEAMAKDDGVRCPTLEADLSDLTISGRFKSSGFARGPVIASSTVEVFRTPQDALASFQRGTKLAFVGCYDDDFRKAMEPDLSAELVSGRVVAAPRVGIRRFALRLVWDVSSGPGTAAIRMYLDMVGWDRGRASTRLFVFAYGAPADGALVRRTAQRIDARMRP